MDIFVILLVLFSSVVLPSGAYQNSFNYGNCSSRMLGPETPLLADVKAVLTSLANSSSSSSGGSALFNSSASASGVVFGIYQCRGDLSGSACHNCVGQAVRQLGTLCPNASGGDLQLNDCLVRVAANGSFAGVEDKAVRAHVCSPQESDPSDKLGARDVVLTKISEATGHYFRSESSWRVYEEAQCTEDLDNAKCQGCISSAIAKMKQLCPFSPFSDVFLSSCYVRASDYGEPLESDASEIRMISIIKIVVPVVLGGALFLFLVGLIWSASAGH